MSGNGSGRANSSLAEVDGEVAAIVERELERQRSTLDLIASENYAPVAVLEATGSVLTNKYAEGYPGRRYYGGCEFVDDAESLAMRRAESLFGAEHVNVQPHSGSQANNAVYMAALDAGDTILSMELAHGGHLSHGLKANISGRLYDIVGYGVDRETYLVDMDVVERLAVEHRPKLIIAGWSAYPRRLDFERFRAVADRVGAMLMVDMAHFAGLVAAGLHPSPVPYADFVTSTTHKTLGGPRSGLILCKEKYAKKIDSAVFPGQQGGPLEHVIAAKAVCFKIAAGDEFVARQKITIGNAQALAQELSLGGLDVLTGGTDVHLLLVDLRSTPHTGRDAEDRLAQVGITVNRNAIPFDERPPMIASGLRMGTPALTTRGLGEDDVREVGRIIVRALADGYDDARREELSGRVRMLLDKYPLYADLSVPVAA